jgi:peptidoglycan-associated lipoprotein
MVEIPVKHKVPAAGLAAVPSWAWVVGAVAIVGIVGLGVGLQECGANKVADNTMVTTLKAGCTADSECSDSQLCVSTACVDIKAGLANCVTAQVHFDTDAAVLRDVDKPEVGRMARCLKADQSIKLVIAGSADERGLSDHNAELGEKRAMAVATTLQAQGVSSTQLRVVSYGENYQLCQDSDRACWARNRQASLTPQPGALATP